MTIDQVISPIVCDRAGPQPRLTQAAQYRLERRLNDFVSAYPDAQRVWLSSHAELGVLLTLAEPSHPLALAAQVAVQDMHHFLSVGSTPGQQRQEHRDRDTAADPAVRV